MFATEIASMIMSRKPEGNTSVECFEAVDRFGEFLLVESWESIRRRVAY